jgi:hypothetical protein
MDRPHSGTTKLHRLEENIGRVNVHRFLTSPESRKQSDAFTPIHQNENNGGFF